MNIFPLYACAVGYFLLFALLTAALSAASKAQDKLDGLIFTQAPARILLLQKARAERTAALAAGAMLLISLALVAAGQLAGFPF